LWISSSKTTRKSGFGKRQTFKDDISYENVDQDAFTLGDEHNYEEEDTTREEIEEK